MATKKTWEWAKRKALLAYHKALKAAERDDWYEAQRLTNPMECAFCEVAPDGPKDSMCRPGDCLVAYICQRRQPQWNAGLVRGGSRTPAAGLRHFRLTIKQLEALDV